MRRANFVGPLGLEELVRAFESLPALKILDFRSRSYCVQWNFADHYPLSIAII
jgi:hypothetical protein